MQTSSEIKVKSSEIQKAINSVKINNSEAIHIREITQEVIGLKSSSFQSQPEQPNPETIEF